MHDTDTETELRATFARETARLPTHDDFEHKVRQRIRVRRRVHRTKMLTLSALTAAIAVAAGVVITRGDDSSTIIQTQAPPSSSATSTTTVSSAAVAMIDVVGLDYRDAQQRLAPLNARVRLALEYTQSNEGTVTHTTPSAGAPTNGEIIVHVAWNRSSVPSLPPTGPGPGTGQSVLSNEAFRPAGLVAGLASADPDQRCERAELTDGIPVRFLHGELVGCVTGTKLANGHLIFIWLDQLDHVNDVIATMPDVVGLTYIEAAQRLKALDPAVLAGGFGIQTTGADTTKVARVLATTPTAGQPITRLGGISLTLDAPPPLASPTTTTTR